jgi:hypothetical protein
MVPETSFDMETFYKQPDKSIRKASGDRAKAPD